MFNITEVVRTLRDAETVASSRLLNDDEKRLLLSQLTATGAASPLQSAKMVIDAINRERPKHGNDKRPTAEPAAPRKEQGRTTKGLKEPAKVAPQGVKEQAETTSGPTKGRDGKAEDLGSVAGQSGGDTARRDAEDATQTPPKTACTP